MGRGLFFRDMLGRVQLFRMLLVGWLGGFFLSTSNHSFEASTDAMKDGFFWFDGFARRRHLGIETEGLWIGGRTYAPDKGGAQPLNRNVGGGL